MAKSKKDFLKSYLLQQPRIERLKEMAFNNPSKKDFYNTQIDLCKKKRNLIEEKISAMDDEVLEEILIQKYICGKTLEEISIILNYSKRHTERLHSIALKKFKV